METPSISVEDEGEALSFTWASLYAYGGPKQIIASALVFRLLERAFQDLSPDRPPDRASIGFLSAFPGRGIAECVELVTRIGTRLPERYEVSPEAAPAEAPLAIDGRLYFEVQIRRERRGYWPSAAFFDDVFRDRVTRYQEGAGMREEQAAYLAYKRELASSILAAPSETLFSSRAAAPRAWADS